MTTCRATVVALAVASALLATGCSCGAQLAPSDAAPPDSAYVDAAPRDAAHPCGQGVTLRWLDAPVGEGVRVWHVDSAPLGAGALVLWLEALDASGGGIAFKLGRLPTLDSPTVTPLSYVPLTRPQWLLTDGDGALIAENLDTAGVLGFRWARLDEAGLGPPREVSWPVPDGVSAVATGACSGAPAIPILLTGADTRVGGALVRWDEAERASLSELVLPEDWSLGAVGRGLAEHPNVEACVVAGPVAYVLARNAYTGPLRLLRWQNDTLLELPQALGTERAVGGAAMVDAEGPLFFSFDDSVPTIARAFRVSASGAIVELHARALDAFPDAPRPRGAVMLADGTAMLFYEVNGLLIAIGFADGRFGVPTPITDFVCTTQSAGYAQGGRVLWPAACGTGEGSRWELAVFELCGGAR